MSNSLNSDQARQFVGPDLCPNCLQRLLADDTGGQRVKAKIAYSDFDTRKLNAENCKGNGYFFFN